MAADMCAQPGQPVVLPHDALRLFLAHSATRDHLDPDWNPPSAPAWAIRRAEVFDAIEVVAAWAGTWFDDVGQARHDMFKDAAGGGFGIPDHLVEVVLGLLSRAVPVMTTTPGAKRVRRSVPAVPGEWREPERAAAVRQAAIALACYAARSTDLDPRPEVRRELINRYVLWFATTGTLRHKYDTRYRSRASLETRGVAPLIHEHVFTRQSLAAALLERPTDRRIAQIVNALAFGCTVTADEHARLSAFDRTHRGWDRYRQAGIEVIDMVTGLSGYPDHSLV